MDSAQSDRSFEFVGGSPVFGVSRLPETRDSILRSFGDCPAHFFVHASKLGGSSLSGKGRIERAWLAGQWASAVRDRRIGSPNRTPALDLRPRCYARTNAVRAFDWARAAFAK